MAVPFPLVASLLYLSGTLWTAACAVPHRQRVLFAHVEAGRVDEPDRDGVAVGALELEVLHLAQRELGEGRVVEVRDRHRRLRVVLAPVDLGQLGRPAERVVLEEERAAGGL